MRMLDAAAAAGEHDRGVGLAGIGRRRLAQREREQDEADRVEQQQERGEAGNHRVWRNAASTAVRATHVASTVSAIGRSSRTTKSSPEQESRLPVSSPANEAPLARSSRMIAAGGRAADASDDRVDRDPALEQVRELEVGRADPVHDLDREAVGVERAAGGEDDGRGGRPLSSRTRPSASHCSSAQRTQAAAPGCRGGR